MTQTIQPVGRRTVLARTRLDFWLDAALLAVYTLGFTGIAIHEWLGLGLGLALLVHLTLHWDWVVRTSRRLVGRNGRSRPWSSRSPSAAASGGGPGEPQSSPPAAAGQAGRSVVRCRRPKRRV